MGKEFEKYTTEQEKTGNLSIGQPVVMPAIDSDRIKYFIGQMDPATMDREVHWFIVASFVADDLFTYRGLDEETFVIAFIDKFIKQPRWVLPRVISFILSEPQANSPQIKERLKKLIHKTIEKDVYDIFVMYALIMDSVGMGIQTYENAWHLFLSLDQLATDKALTEFMHTKATVLNAHKGSDNEGNNAAEDSDVNVVNTIDGYIQATSRYTDKVKQANDTFMALNDRELSIDELKKYMTLNGDEETLLNYACTLNRQDTVMNLVEKPYCDMSSAIVHALRLPVEDKCYSNELLTKLIQYSCEHNTDLSSFPKTSTYTNMQEKTPLLLLLSHEKYDLIEILLHSNCAININGLKRNFVLEVENEEFAQEDYGEDYEQALEDEIKESFLSLLINRYQSKNLSDDVWHKLIDLVLNRDDLDVTIPLNSPVCAAFKIGDFILVERLYEKGAALPLDQAKDLMLAALKMPTMDGVHFLIQKGLSFDFTDEELLNAISTTSHMAPMILFFKLESQPLIYAQLMEKAPASLAYDQNMPAPISLSLFAHINNDAELVGTRKLEGQRFANTVRFMRYFVSEIKANHTSFPKELLDEKAIDRLQDKLTHMSILEDGIRDAAWLIDLRLLNNEERNERYLELTRNTAEKLMEQLTFENEEGVFMPGGWTSTIIPGHQMIYELKCDINGDLLCIMYNSGLGIHHHMKAASLDKDRYHPVKVYKIPKENITLDNINAFMANRMKPQVEPVVLLRSSPEYVDYDVDTTYEEFNKDVLCLGGTEVDPKSLGPSFAEVLTAGQRSGTCAEGCLHEMIKTLFSKDIAKLFICCLKKYSIEAFCEQHPSDLNLDAVDQIKLALENLNSIVLNKIDKHYRNDLMEACADLTDKVNDIILQAETNLQRSLPDLSVINVVLTTKTVLDGVPKLAMQFVSSASLTNDKRFAVPISSDKLTQQPFELANLIEFINDLTSLKDIYEHEAIVTSIENLLLSISIESENYTSIKNTADALKFIDALEKILKIYGESCHIIDPNANLSPRKIVCLLSGSSLMSLILSIDGISIGNLGANVTDNVNLKGLNMITNAYYGVFLNSLTRNAFLSSYDPLVDKKLGDIIAHDGYDLRLPSMTIENVFKNYIDSHYDPAFKKTLIELFDRKCANKFSMKEIEKIKGDHYEAITAFSDMLIDELTQLDTSSMIAGDLTKYRDEMNKIKLIHNIEKLNTSIFYTISFFQYFHLINPSGSGYIDAGSVSPPLYAHPLEYPLKINPLIFKEGNIVVLQIPKMALESTEAQHPNNIQCQPAGVKVDGVSQNHSVDNIINKMMFHLRTSLSTQVISSIDFFKQHIELLKTLDYQIYLEKNIFQPGLLLSGLAETYQFYESVNGFIDFGIQFSSGIKSDINTLYYFLRLKTLFNCYVLSSEFTFHHDRSMQTLSNLKPVLEDRLQKPIGPEINMILRLCWLK